MQEHRLLLLLTCSEIFSVVSVYYRVSGSNGLNGTRVFVNRHNALIRGIPFYSITLIALDPIRDGERFRSSLVHPHSGLADHNILCVVNLPVTSMSPIA